MSSTGPSELTHRSLWLQEALAVEGESLVAEPLAGTSRADVCILGGGYTGLWTALFLKEREPALDVAIVEADVCGAGASGRNGGFALSWWAKLATLAKVCGEGDGMWLAREAERGVDFVGEFCHANGIEADFCKAGWLWAATSPAQVGSWEPTLAEAERRGVDAFVRLTPAEVQSRGGSRAYLAGVLERSAATVHPGKLARGLRRIALERGVRIFERSPVYAVEGRSPLVVRTPGGRVEAETVVSALNAWTPGLAQLRHLARAFVPVASDMIATAPVSELLERIGWTGGECITDSRLLVHYHRTTRDGRIAIGRGGSALGAGGRFGETFHYDRRRSESVSRSLQTLYPELERVPVTHAWSGPIDRSETGIPFFGRAKDHENLVYGVGFSGNGVAPCALGGRILASLALRSDDRWSATALSRGPTVLFPPEPIRFLGGTLVRQAVKRKELLEDEGRVPGRATRVLAGLAPAGLFKVDDRRGAEASSRKSPSG